MDVPGFPTSASPAPAAAANASASPLRTVLTGLRGGLHATFYFLLAFGAVASLLDGSLTPLAGLITVLLAGVYASGMWWHPAWLWLATVTFLWLGLMVHAQDFMWLAFPIAFLYLHLLPRWSGILAVLGIWAAAAFIPRWRFPDDWELAIAIGPFIGLCFAVAVYYAYRGLLAEAAHHRQVAEQLRETQDELARSEHNAGRLEERERLSREIHDTVAQGLSSIVLLARAAKANSDDPARLSEQLATIEEQASTNLDEARRFVQDLAAAPAHTVNDRIDSVIAAARAHQRALDVPLEITLHRDGSLPTSATGLSEDTANTIVRVVQEGLNNVMRHADATKAVITLTELGGKNSPAELSIDVIDNGRGMSGSFGYGLTGLRRRVELSGGALTIESTAGEGTALTALIPLRSSPAQTTTTTNPTEHRHG